MSVLAPRLRPLDEQVLAALDGRGKRSDRVADLVLGAAYWHCMNCDRRVPASDTTHRSWKSGHAIQCLACLERLGWVSSAAGRTSRPVRVATDDQRREVREILRGLEARGHATCRGGWWRRK